MTAIAETVTFKSASGTVQLAGYLARPDGSVTGSLPGVVVIHEIYGLNENIKDIARRFADEGYVALAVDLFAGRNRTVCMFRFLGGMLLNSLDHVGIHDLKAALSFLGDQPDVDKARLGAIGYCLGGSFAIAWACTDQRLKAIAPYYSFNPRPIKAVERSCAVVGSFPEHDFTRNQGKKLDEALDTYKVEHDIKIYPDAKHSFFNDKGENYNADAAKDSWQRVLGFFKAHIG